MIILVVVLAILLLISIVVNFHLFKKAKVNQETAQYFERIWKYEKRDSQVHQRKVNDLEKEITELKASNSQELKPESEDERGSFVCTRNLRDATAETYRNVFDLDINGKRVIDSLEKMFAKKSTYVRGGPEAERESCFKAGQAFVIGFIINQINKANSPDCKEEVDE